MGGENSATSWMVVTIVWVSDKQNAKGLWE